jgi:hypothetical protein
MIEIAVKNLDFQKIIQTMTHLHWHHFDMPVPNEAQLVDKAVKMVRDTIEYGRQEGPHYTSSGGFMCVYFSGMDKGGPYETVVISFSITSGTFCEEDLEC